MKIKTLKSLIVKILESHKGRDNPIKIDVICEKIEKITGDNVKNSIIRKAIRSLIIDDGLLIGSCYSGVYLIKTKSELLEVVNNLTSRKIEIDLRINSLIRNWSKKSKYVNLK